MLTMMHHAPCRRRRERHRREREREAQRERECARRSRARRRTTVPDASVASHGPPRCDARDAFVPSLHCVLIIYVAFAHVLHIYMYDVPSHPSDGSARRRARRPPTADRRPPRCASRVVCRRRRRLSARDRAQRGDVDAVPQGGVQAQEDRRQCRAIVVVEHLSRRSRGGERGEGSRGEWYRRARGSREVDGVREWVECGEEARARARERAGSSGERGERVALFQGFVGGSREWSGGARGEDVFG